MKSGGQRTSKPRMEDFYFGPKTPEGFEDNWLETIPGKSWFFAFRLYGPLEPWIDKTWRPGEVALVD